MSNNEINALNNNDSEVESVRYFMIEMYSNKIQDHVLLLFAVVGAWYTFLKTSSDSNFLQNKKLISLIFACLVWISIYSFGRLIFWSQYNSILLTVEPFNKTTAVPEGYKDNLIWNFHEAVLSRIRGQAPYNISDRTINIRLANFMARSWIFNFWIHGIALAAFYSSYYWKNILQRLEKHSHIITPFIILVPAFIFILLWFVNWIFFKM